MLLKIYFSGSISGGRDHAAIYQHLVARLQALGHNVLSAHVADPDVLEREQATPPRAVFDRDVAWVRECDVMIAEVSTPSLGVGYEYGLAVQLGKPVLCVYQSGLRLSKMITGNSAPSLTVAAYTDEAELDGEIDGFLDKALLLVASCRLFTNPAAEMTTPPRPPSPPKKSTHTDPRQDRSA